jgi:Cu/Ag efflux pump CusA
MIRWLVGSSLRLAALIGVAAVVILFVGITQVRNAPVDVYPEFTPPQVQIQTEALGLSAAEVESLITVPMENELNGVPWVEQITSQSVPGLSSINLRFKRGTDLYRARQMVTERLAQGPGVAKVGSPPTMIQPLSSTSRVEMIGLTAKDLNPLEMSILAWWKIRPRLLGIPGVANVAIWGQRDRQLQIQVDPAKLHAHGIDLNKVIDTAGNTLWSSPLTFVEASTPGADGFVDTPNQRLGIQHILPITNAKDLAGVTFEDTGGQTLHLGDVATVTEDHQPLIGDAILKGTSPATPGLVVVVQKSPGANTLQVTKAVNDAMKALEPGLGGITVDTKVYRPASYVDDALHTIGWAALAGLLLAMVALGLLLYSWRVALISLVTILTSLVAAAYVLYLTGTTFNVMILAGLVIAVGAVVDDAVGDLVTIRRRLREYRAGPANSTLRSSGDESGSSGPILEAVRNAALETRGPLGYAFVVIVLAAVPVFLLTGVAGTFAQPLIKAYALALAASLLVALTLTPALAYLLLPAGSGKLRRGPLTGIGRRAYLAVVPPVIRRPVLGFGLLALLLAAGLAAIPLLSSGKSMIPAPKDRTLAVHWQAVAGTSLTEMDRVTSLAAAELRTVPGVKEVGAHVGRAIAGDQTTDVDSGEMWVTLAGDADYAATVNRVKQVVAGYPGIGHEVLTYPQDQLKNAETTPARPLTVRVYGQEFDTLNAQAEQLRRLMSQVKGVRGARVDTQPLVPTIAIQVDLTKAQEYGLKPGDVRRAAATLVNGLLVGNLYENQRIFDVVVIGKQDLRSNMTEVQNLLLDTSSGRQVRLRDVATVQITPSPPTIVHNAASRSVDITADVRGRDLDAVVSELRNKIQARTFPLEYHADVIDNQGDTDDNNVRLLAYSLAAALGVFLVLQAAFRSWRRAGLVFVLLPLGVSGGVATSALVGGLDSAGQLIGLLMVLGLTVRAGIVLVRRLQFLEDTDADASREDLVQRAARERSLPVLTMAVVTGAALLPFAVVDAAGTELLRPLAVTAIGGLVSVALVTLFVLPALYLRFVPDPRQRPPRPEIPAAREPEPDPEAETEALDETGGHAAPAGAEA